METRRNLNKNPKYANLFCSAQAKADAFDQIAALYYNKNFGSISKTDLDVLMFSLYIERILDNSEADMETYSDYELSKQLGITQSKIKNLKIRKELVYPYQGFDWKQSFARVCQKARYEDGKIIINITDPNLFIELKHFVELKNGTVDIRLNSNLFVITIDMFVELLLHIGKEDDQKFILQNIRKTYQHHKIETANIEKATIGKYIKDNAGKISAKLILQGIKECADSLTPPLNIIVDNIVDIVSGS